MSWVLNPHRFGSGASYELVVYPDAHTESTTVDGYARRSGVDETFSTIRAGAGNSASDTATTGYCANLITSATTNKFSQMLRGILLFDTSSIPSGATITGVVLSLYGINKWNQLASNNLVIVSSTPASNTAIANGDYANLGSTLLGEIAYADFALSAYNDITLSASAVTKAGITKLGTRMRWDYDNSFSETWVASKSNGYSIAYADNGSNKPKLTVNYTA